MFTASLTYLASVLDDLEHHITHFQPDIDWVGRIAVNYMSDDVQTIINQRVFADKQWESFVREGISNRR